MKKINKKDNKYYRFHNILTFIVVIMILIMSIVCINMIVEISYNKYVNDDINEFNNSLLETKRIYDTSSLFFIEISLTDEPNELSNTCSKGCNLIVKNLPIEYKLIISKSENSHFLLDVVYNEKAVVRGKDLGISLDKLLLYNIDNNLVLFNVYKDRIAKKDYTTEEYSYDYAFVINKNFETDEFSSLFEDEMRFTTEGITYTYDVCENSLEGNAKRIVAIRKPFSKNASILNSEVTSYSWCENK